MFTKHSTQLACSLEELFFINDFTLSGLVCDGSGVEAQGKEGADKEGGKLHDGCKLRRRLIR